ncbi:MAG: ABC transporter ATP-binding protein [Campylobacterales bacterium]|nr:ABC transporter ATP-binding protein [Campylobacterales bacterium]
MPIVQVKNLSKAFKGVEVLKHLTFSIQPNQITGLIGADGAGKTTLIRILCAFYEFEADEVIILDYNLKHHTTNIQELIGYMPQKFGLYEDLSVKENMYLYANLQSIAKDTIQQRVDELLAFTTLKNFENFLASNLSGGMKQKLGLACSLIKKPKLLLLDEPGVGVDPISRKELWAMVQNLTNEGVTVLWSTAYLDEAQLCDEVLLLNEGEILFQGKPAQLTKQMEGRVFGIFGAMEDRHHVLSLALNSEHIKDGLILGDSIKLITDESGYLPPLASIGAPNATFKPLSPTFEDGFMHLLGVDFDGTSPLKEFIKPISLNQEYVIEVQNLTKSFGDFKAADHITFSIKQGEIFGLLGPNGAGKSTTFKMLCGLLKPTSGKANILGYSFTKSSLKARAKIGYMSQKFSLYGDLSVLENLRFFAGVYELRGEAKSHAISQMLNIFDLHRYSLMPSKELPLGYKQRLSLACAIMHNPAILFLDEPTSGVDPLTRREFWNHIYAMVQKGVTIMVTTHFMEEAEYCDNIALIYKGRAIAIDTPHNLINQISPTATMQEAFIELIQRSDHEA